MTLDLYMDEHVRRSITNGLNKVARCQRSHGTIR
jgi:hypothetical protein